MKFHAQEIARLSNCIRHTGDRVVVRVVTECPALSAPLVEDESQVRLPRCAAVDSANRMSSGSRAISHVHIVRVCIEISQLRFLLGLHSDAVDRGATSVVVDRHSRAGVRRDRDRERRSRSKAIVVSRSRHHPAIGHTETRDAAVRWCDHRTAACRSQGLRAGTRLALSSCASISHSDRRENCMPTNVAEEVAHGVRRCVAQHTRACGEIDSSQRRSPLRPGRCLCRHTTTTVINHRDRPTLQSCSA
jgi:hypothetical protein